MLGIYRAAVINNQIVSDSAGFNGGLLTNEKAQVIKKNGKPIEGLYAIGNNAASSMGESYPGAGVTIGPALTFGYIAARHMSGAND